MINNQLLYHCHYDCFISYFSSFSKVDQQTITAKWGRPLFSSSLYATCCLLLVIMAGYFEFHRMETFEAVYRGTGPVPFSVKFSVKGEKVNLYLRLGLASK